MRFSRPDRHVYKNKNSVYNMTAIFTIYIAYVYVGGCPNYYSMFTVIIHSAANSEKETEAVAIIMTRTASALLSLLLCLGLASTAFAQTDKPYVLLFFIIQYYYHYSLWPR